MIVAVNRYVITPSKPVEIRNHQNVLHSYIEQFGPAYRLVVISRRD